MTPAPAHHAAKPTNDFLAFKLGPEEYGIHILRVQEIRSYEEPARIAGAPAFIKGVLNLRGAVIPILDMRLLFGLAQCRYDAVTAVIVLHVASRVVGLVVDAVSDVLNLTEAQMRPAPQLQGGFLADHLLSIGSVEQRTLLLLDIDRMTADPAMGLMEARALPTVQG